MPHTNLKVGKEIPAFPEILNERPSGMRFEDYKAIRKEQAKRLKRRLRSGFFLNKNPNSALANKK